jgi:hypothetical protein
MVFDGVKKIITLDADASVEVSDIYFSWKSWSMSSDNTKYPQAFRYVGGDDTTEGQKLGITFFLINGWKIRPYEKSYILNLSGNIYSDDGESPFINTIGDYNVLIQNTVSNLTTVVEVSTSGSTLTAKEIRDTIMNTPLTNLTDKSTFGGWVAKGLLSIKKFLALS